MITSAAMITAMIELYQAVCLDQQLYQQRQCRQYKTSSAGQGLVRQILQRRQITGLDLVVQVQ